VDCDSEHRFHHLELSDVCTKSECQCDPLRDVVQFPVRRRSTATKCQCGGRLLQNWIAYYGWDPGTGRGRHANSHTYSQPDANSNCDAYINSYTYGNLYTYAHPNCYSDRYGDGYRDSYGYGNPHAYSDRDLYANTYAHVDADIYPDVYSKAYTDSETESHSETSPYSAAAALIPSDQ